MNISDIVPLLNHVRRLSDNRYIACCPAHEDKNPSLSLRESGKRILVFCHSGCNFKEITNALGIDPQDWFDDQVIPVHVRAAREVRQQEIKARTYMHRLDQIRVKQLAKELRQRDERKQRISAAVVAGIINENDGLDLLGEVYDGYSELEYEFWQLLEQTDMDEEPIPDPMTEAEQKQWIEKLTAYFAEQKHQ